MTERDTQKIINAGFSLLKPCYDTLRIKIRNRYHTWSTFEKGFTNRLGLDQRFNELLQHPKNIEA